MIVTERLGGLIRENKETPYEASARVAAVFEDAEVIRANSRVWRTHDHSVDPAGLRFQAKAERKYSLAKRDLAQPNERVSIEIFPGMIGQISLPVPDIFRFRKSTDSESSKVDDFNLEGTRTQIAAMIAQEESEV